MTGQGRGAGAVFRKNPQASKRCVHRLEKGNTSEKTMHTITRDLADEILAMANSYPVVTVIGPRQSGKTTLVKEIFPQKPYVSLEDPDEQAFANSDPRGFL